MKKRLMKLLLLSSFMLSGLCYGSVFQSQDRIYLDSDDFNSNEESDEFHIHIGENVWLVTNTIHRDSTGIFAFDSSVRRSIKDSKREYERKWKCPYCYNYWPIGTACQKVDCPSKYK